MATLFNQIGANFDARLAAHAASIEAGGKARQEFREEKSDEFEAAAASFEKSRDQVREEKKSDLEATIKSAVNAFESTRDAILNTSDNSLVDTIADFAAELEENQEAISEKISTHETSHKDEIEAILSDLGPDSDFADNYGAELPAYSADDYSA